MSRHTIAGWGILVLTLAGLGRVDGQPAKPATSQPKVDLAAEYREPAERIIRAVRQGNDAWKKLEELCDDVGHRISGSEALDHALAWAKRTFEADGQENVRLEKVMVPKWVRGRESLVMVKPRAAELVILGVGGSDGTPPDGITAPVLVVANEDELKAAGDKAKGKIVLFNNPMPPFDAAHNNTGYGTTVKYRGIGSELTAAQGGVACLVRSVTARSLRSPHTGAMRHKDKKTVPTAAVSIEDAEMMARMTARGKEVVVTLKMEAKTEPDVPSANVVAELRGREKPEEIVVIGGHIDSWDVGQGAHDDGAGAVMCMEAINVLRKLKLIPRRTIRVVLFTNEENGLRGGLEYAQDHAAEMGKHVAAIESDTGAFRPLGFSVQHKDDARASRAAERLQAVLPLLAPLGSDRIKTGHGGADISPMEDHGVLLMGLELDGSTYFDYHHTHADTLDKVDPKLLSDDVAAMAIMSYILADMPERPGE